MKKEYFYWLCRLVYDRDKYNYNYDLLLHFLKKKSFTYSCEMDVNRLTDAIDLRYRFGYEQSYPRDLVECVLIDNTCNVFEMMVALAIRCENFMDDPDYDNRTSKWFWTMIESLGLDQMDNEHFDSSICDHIIDKFLNREYQPNGKGGLFTVNRCDIDMRNIEIWYQAMIFFDEYLGYTN